MIVTAGIAALAFSLALIWEVAVPSGAYAQSQARIIDGDTLDIQGKRIRLWGIDAPEGKQTCTRDGIDWLCGQEAAKALRTFVASDAVSCEDRDTDRYKRSVAVCSVRGIEINAWMVQNGWALDYRQFSRGAYGAQERQAREERNGLWTGAFEKPWEWRRKHR